MDALKLDFIHFGEQPLQQLNLGNPALGCRDLEVTPKGLLDPEVQRCVPDRPSGTGQGAERVGSGRWCPLVALRWWRWCNAHDQSSPMKSTAALATASALILRLGCSASDPAFPWS